MKNNNQQHLISIDIKLIIKQMGLGIDNSNLFHTEKDILPLKEEGEKRNLL